MHTLGKLEGKLDALHAQVVIQNGRIGKVESGKIDKEDVIRLNADTDHDQREFNRRISRNEKAIWAIGGGVAVLQALTYLVK